MQQRKWDRKGYGKMGKRLSRGEKVFTIANYIFMVIFTLIILIPMISVVVRSFLSEQEIARRGMFVLFPEDWHWDAYRMLWASHGNILRAYGNTLFITVVGTTLNLTFTIMLAYGLSKKYLRGRSFINGMVFFTMLFGGGMVPSYMLNKALHMINTRWVLIIPGLVNSWNMFMMRNFFYAIPDSLEESALLDGANPIQVLVKIVLPCSVASIATIGLFYAVGHWNQWFAATIFITDSKLLPMQNILRNIISSDSLSDLDTAALNTLEYIKPPQEALKGATIVITTLPILLVYPFIQKYFVKGVMVGSIKG